MTKSRDMQIMRFGVNSIERVCKGCGIKSKLTEATIIQKS